MSRFYKLRSISLVSVSMAFSLSWAAANSSVNVVLQNGQAIPLSALALEGDKLVITTETNGLAPGQSFGIASADHVYGERPPELNQGIALLLTDKVDTALKLLEPILEQHKASAKIPGNFWLETARVILIAHALKGNTVKCNELGPQISDATLAPGPDPFVTLSKALLLPLSTAPNVSETAFTDLISNDLPADICAYASFYRGNLLKRIKRNTEAFDAYLSVSTLFPAGSVVLNGAAELQVADHLLSLKQNDEAKILLKSAATQADGTVIAEESNKRLENLK
jgi:hypothetical protein